MDTYETLTGLKIEDRFAILDSKMVLSKLLTKN